MEKLPAEKSNIKVADSEKLALEKQKLAIEIQEASLRLEKTKLELIKSQREIDTISAKAEEARIYSFFENVNKDSVEEAINSLTAWGRKDPGSPLTIIINSPGGSVMDGFALYDTLEELKNEGHKVTTIVRGRAASMGAVLMQVGSERLIGQNACILLHETSTAIQGKSGNFEDAIRLIELQEDKILEILSCRSKLTPAKIKKNWARKDWWLSAQEVLELKLADRIG